MSKLASSFVVALAVASAGAALAQSIEITSDLAGTEREGQALPGTGATLYILGRPSPAGPEVGGAEFWVNGLPAGWTAVSIPNPTCVIAVGNPFATVTPFRANIAFSPCPRPDANGVVLLYTVVLVPSSLVNDVCLTVQVAVPPSNRFYTTPILIVGCDPPDPYYAAATGTRFIVNPVTRQCTTGVERRAWSDVKALYTN